MSHQPLLTGSLIVALSLLSMPCVRADGPIMCPPHINAADLPAVKTKVVLHGVDVGADSAAIAADSKPVLDEAVDLVANAERAVVVVDDDAKCATSEALDRANSIQSYLVEHGVTAGRIAVNGCSASDAALTNACAATHVSDYPVELHTN